MDRARSVASPDVKSERKGQLGTGGTDAAELAEEQGLLENGQLNPKVKATQVTDWLKREFGLGHGHAMAIYATFKGKTE